MSNETKLSAQLREKQGSINSRRMRRAGMVPAALNNTKGEITLLKLDEHAFDVLMHHHHNENLLLSLFIEGKGDVMAQIVELQHHGVTGKVLHVDFEEISMKERMTALVTVNLIGDPEGVKNGGGLLDQQVHQVEVSCMPSDLIEEISLDVSALEIGGSLSVRDLALGDKIELIGDLDQVVAHVVPPHVETEEEEEDETVEPELIGAKEETQE